MRPSEKFEAKAAGQKCSEAWFSPRREHFWPTTQASGFAAGRNRAGYWDKLFTLRFTSSSKWMVVFVNDFCFITMNFSAQRQPVNASIVHYLSSTAHVPLGWGFRTGKEIRFRFGSSEDKAGKEAKRRPTGW